MTRQNTLSVYRRILKQWPLYLMMVPGLAYLLINNYLPLAGLQLAFKKFKYALGIWKSDFNNFKNFTYLFKSSDAWIIIRNTVGYNLVFILLGTVVAIFVAILLNMVRVKRMQKFYQTVILIPHLISYVIVSYIVYAFLGQDNGMINNSLLKALGMEPIAWYTEAAYWPYILVITQLWKTFGYNSIIYYATIVGIDQTYYEAAIVDGANLLQQIWYVELPAIKDIIVIQFILQAGNIMSIGFEKAYALQTDMNLPASEILSTYVYRIGLLNGDYGYSTAVGLFNSVINVILLIFVNWVVKKLNDGEGL